MATIARCVCRGGAVDALAVVSLAAGFGAPGVRGGVWRAVVPVGAKRCPIGLGAVVPVVGAGAFTTQIMSNAGNSC